MSEQAPSPAGVVVPVATLLLPPLVLPPRQLKKVQIACKKWLTRFLSTLVTFQSAGRTAATHSCCENTSNALHTVEDVAALAAQVFRGHAAYSGFVALNGGILAGCSPHDVREVLISHGLLSPPPSPMECVLEYSSTLPFVFCTRSLMTGGGLGVLSALHVMPLELSPYAVSTRASSELGHSVASTEGYENTLGEENLALPRTSHTDATTAGVSVVVLQLPSAEVLWKGGSSGTASSGQRGSGFLYLVPCDLARVHACVPDLLQRPVVGIDQLLSKSLVHKKTQVTPCSPRTCVSTAVTAIPGLYLVPDFLTGEEEAAIWQELQENRQQLRLEYLSRRRVAHFNRRFIYGANALTNVGEDVNALPSFYEWMRARLQNDDVLHHVRLVGNYPFGPGDYPCDQLTVNYYDYRKMGACGISTHVDAHKAFADAILIVSMGSYTVMDFARWDDPAEARAPTGVYLAPRSLAVLSGEARYGWTHCIAEKRTDTVSELLPTCIRDDRVSLTWRRGRTGPHLKASCPFPALCDGD